MILFGYRGQSKANYFIILRDESCMEVPPSAHKKNKQFGSSLNYTKIGGLNDTKVNIEDKNHMCLRYEENIV